MIRAEILLVSVVLPLVPVAGLCQQEVAAPDASDTRAAETAATPTPASSALRRAVAAAVEETSTATPKAAPTPPPGSGGVVAAADGGGGMFVDSDSSGYAYVGYGNFGIEALGSFTGGYFGDTDQTGYAYAGYGDAGVRGYGSFTGGYFQDTDSTGYIYVGYGDYGAAAFGSFTGGYFEDRDGSGYAFAAYDRPNPLVDNGGTANNGEYGVYAGGNKAGGYFEDTNNSSYAYLAELNYGIHAFGSLAAGYFHDTDSSDYAYVAYSTYKINGTGSVSFIQNHPYDPSSVIVYAAPEGDEVATYTRGTARLVNGEATVPLGETFKWVTNPDIGLTAHLTPRGKPVPLAVVKLTTEELVVRAAPDAPDGLVFDYLVYGLRIGFEETSVVQEKRQEAYIPSMKDHRDLYARRPDLRRYDSLERFKEMRHAVGKSVEPDLSRAHALRDAIIEFDPSVQTLPRPFMPPTDKPSGETAACEKPVAEREDNAPVQQHQLSEERVAPDRSSLTTRIPVDAEGNVYASSFRPAARDLASLVEVSEAVEPGDILVIDHENAGMMRLGREHADSGVIGIVAAAPGLVLGARPATAAITEQEGRPDTALGAQGAASATAALEVPVAFSGVATCKVDASYGAIWPGDLLVTSPTAGHAMAEQSPLPGTVLGKALEPLAEGTGTIKVLVMLR